MGWMLGGIKPANAQPIECTLRGGSLTLPRSGGGGQLTVPA